MIKKDLTIDISDIIAWEEGNMSEEDEIVFFQKLIDSGHAWTLQGFYGRHAMAMIEAGLCHEKKEEI